MFASAMANNCTLAEFSTNSMSIHATASSPRYRLLLVYCIADDISIYALIYRIQFMMSPCIYSYITYIAMDSLFNLRVRISHVDAFIAFAVFLPPPPIYLHVYISTNTHNSYSRSRYSGPFAFERTVLPPFHHSTTAIPDNNGGLLLFTIGKDTHGVNLHTCNGSTPRPLVNPP